MACFAIGLAIRGRSLAKSMKRWSAGSLQKHQARKLLAYGLAHQSTRWIGGLRAGEISTRVCNGSRLSENTTRVRGSVTAAASQRPPGASDVLPYCGLGRG